MMSMDFFPSDQTMALESTQPLVKMNNRNIPGGKGGRCVRLTTYHLHVSIVKKSGGLNLLEPFGPVQACNGTALYIYIYTDRLYTSVSQTPGRGPVSGPDINYTGPREVLLEFVILIF